MSPNLRTVPEQYGNRPARSPWDKEPSWPQMSRASGWLNRCTCRDMYMYIYIYSYRGIYKDIGTHNIGMLQDVKDSGFRVEVFFGV